MTAQIDFITLLHCDAHLLIVSKPTGLLSVPGRAPELHDCLINRVLNHYDDARIVHRLDRDTSGVMVLARDAEVHRQLSKQFAHRKTHKRYIARVLGHVDDPEGRIDLPLRKDMDNPPLHRVDPELGKPSRTDYRVIQHEGEHTRLELTPHTGRSHQLRIHCRAIGHPVLGDPLYGCDASQAAATRLMLHAESLTFTHPHTGDERTFTAPCPF